MASIISGLKVSHQVFKCFNCGRKSVSLGNDLYDFKNVSQDTTNESVDDVTEQLEQVEDLLGLDDEWLATCSHCGWSDT